MSLLKWKPVYTIGIPAIDFEHRQMIEMINQLYRQIESVSDRDVIEDGLGEIHAGIAAHFALEEQEMKKAMYGEFEAHKDNHEDLLDQLRDLMDDYADDPNSGRQLLQQQLTDWFGVHFASFDARLHKHMMPEKDQQPS